MTTTAPTPTPTVLFDGFIRYNITREGGGVPRTQRGRVIIARAGDELLGSVHNANADPWVFGITEDSLPTFPLRHSSGTFTTTAGEQVRFGKMCSCSAPAMLSRVPQAELVTAMLSAPTTTKEEPTTTTKEEPEDAQAGGPEQAEEGEAAPAVSPAPHDSLPSSADLNAMNKPELYALAQSYSLKVDEKSLKADIRKALDKHLGL